MVTRIRAALLLALARVGALVAPPSLRRRPAPRQATAVQDLSGDGGVLKTATTGDGAPAFGNDGDVALLTYEARTASGQLLDRGVQTQYTVGDQQFIPGWDLCIRSLAVGERASFAVSSDYAYGIQGVPPAVLANEPLTFDVTALEYRGNIQTSASFASDAPLTPRTPGSIKAEFERRQAEKAVRASSDRALRDERDAEASPLDQVKNAFGDLGDKFFGDEGFYFFGFFESATGEEAPWYLKPYLTFPAIFLGVALSFYGLLQTDVIVLRGDNSPIPGQRGRALHHVRHWVARNVVASNMTAAPPAASLYVPASRSNASISPAAARASRTAFSKSASLAPTFSTSAPTRPSRASSASRSLFSTSATAASSAFRTSAASSCRCASAVSSIVSRARAYSSSTMSSSLRLATNASRSAALTSRSGGGAKSDPRSPSSSSSSSPASSSSARGARGWASNRLLSSARSGSSAASRIKVRRARGCWNAVAPHASTTIPVRRRRGMIGTWCAVSASCDARAQRELQFACTRATGPEAC